MSISNRAINAALTIGKSSDWGKIEQESTQQQSLFYVNPKVAT